MSSRRSARSLLAILSVFCLASIGARVRAEEFSWQLSGGTNRSEPAEGKGESLNAAYYFAPVDDSGGPLALASFLDPTSRLSVSASRLESTGYTYVGGLGGGTFTTEAKSYDLSGRFVLPKSHWYAGGTYATSDVGDLPLSFTRQSDPKAYGLHAGKYLGANTTLELAVTSSKSTSETDSVCVFPQLFCPVRTITFETVTRGVALEAFHLWRARSLAYSLSGGVSQGTTEVDITAAPFTVAPFPTTGTPVSGGFVVSPLSSGFSSRLRVYHAAGEVFPTARIGVRLGYSRPNGDDFGSSDGAFDLATTWFFTPHVGVQFLYSQSSVENVPDPHSSAVRFIGRL